jgi:hypothetical protein
VAMCVCNTTTSCPGCCNGNVCEQYAGQSATACGNGGAGCAPCSAAGEVCASVTSGGACECPDGGTLCDGGCADTKTDPNNCGGCGKLAGAGNVCKGGATWCDTTTGCDGCCEPYGGFGPWTYCVPYSSQSDILCGNGGASCGQCNTSTHQMCVSMPNGGACQ